MATPQGSNEERIACSILERHHSSLSQSMTSPFAVVSICQILYSKKFITERALDEVESSSDTALEVKTKILLAAVKIAILNNHRKLYELATVLDQFKETKAVAKIIISDYTLKITKEAASEAVRKNIVDLNKAISVSFENIILTCEQENLIASDFRQRLQEISVSKQTRCTEFIDYLKNTVGIQPAHLDTFLCILDQQGALTIEVAKSVAKSYDYELPKYGKLSSVKLSTATANTVGGATSVINSDDNVEEIPQMSNEDRAAHDILRTHYSTLSQSLKDPVNIARILHGENVISEDAVTQVELSDTFNQTTVLLGLVRRAVRSNHQNLNKFGRVLGELAAGNERVGLDLLKDYDKAFLTVSSTSNVSTTLLQPNTATDVYHITRDMEEEFSAIRGKFGSTLFKIERTLSKHDSTIVDDVKKFCKFTYPKCSLEIDECRTMGDVLTFVAKKCSLIDISILRELLNSCEIEEAKQHIHIYQHAIDDFSQKMRSRFPLNQSLLPDGTPHPLCGETITFVIDRDPETTSLDDITDLQTYAFGKFAKRVKVIVGQKTNSIRITCSFPCDLTGLLVGEAMKNLKQLKKKHRLLRLTIGYNTIYEAEVVQILSCKDFYQKNKFLICSICLTAVAVIFIAFLIGLLLGTVGTQVAWYFGDRFNIKTVEKNQKETDFLDPILKQINYIDDLHDSIKIGPTQSFNDGNNLQSNIECNIATFISNKLGDVIEEYNNNNGKEWSQWCIQEWRKQYDTSLLSKPTALVDVNGLFNRLGIISKVLNEQLLE